MKYGQEFRFGFDNIDPKDKMKKIAEAGFDGIMTWWGYRFAKRDGTRESIVANAKEFGLELLALHSSFLNNERIWEAGDRGIKVLDRHIETVEACDKYRCKVAVCHVSGVESLPERTDIGLENYYKLFKRAEELGVTVAIENVALTSLNRLLIENLHSPAHKNCYDSGHDNFMSDPGDDVLDMFKGRIAMTHLHDNYKAEEKDSHFLMGDGDVDFKRVFSALKGENLEAICLESRNSPQSKYANVTCEEYLRKSLELVKKGYERGVVGEFGC